MAQETPIAVHEGDDEWLGSIMKDEQKETRIHLGDHSRIPKVPQVLSVMEEDKTSYEPVVISIGPYHHEKTDQLKSMEHIKRRMVRNFVAKRGKGKPIQEFYRKVVAVAEEARRYYEEDATTDVIKFTRMMFLDGCFILQFISCLENNDFGNFSMNLQNTAMVLRDLCLLENQLPLLVLRSLMIIGFSEGEGKKMIKSFIKLVLAQPPPRVSPWKKILPPALSTYASDKGPDIQRGVHLLQLFRQRVVGSAVQVDQNQRQTIWCHNRPATELRRAGIYFRPSKTRAFTDVRFKGQIFLSGRLEIPPLTIDDTTKSLLLNLMAYEASLDASKEVNWVTSYTCFLASLIQDVEDVKLLRWKNILSTYIPEQEVVDLFNQISRNLVPNSLAYGDVRRQIELQCNAAIRKWIAEFRHTYFSSPWSVIALVAAIFTIILTFVQSYLALFPPQK